MFELTGKVALVTGASRGIGRAIALGFARQGATVVVVARGENAAPTAAAIIEAGGQAEALGVDVTDRAALEKLPGAIIERHGRLDILVSNAGITRDQLLMRMKREDWDDVLATNLTATFTLTQAAMRPMVSANQYSASISMAVTGLIPRRWVRKIGSQPAMAHSFPNWKKSSRLKRTAPGLRSSARMARGEG